VQSSYVQAAKTMPYMALLALHDGDWGKMLQESARGTKVAREAIYALSHKHSDTPAWLMRLLLTILPRAIPFNFRAYAAEHFGRHVSQTIAMLEEWKQLSSVPTPNLDSLLRELKTHEYARSR
jgi:hypothetical protein